MVGLLRLVLSFVVSVDLRFRAGTCSHKSNYIVFAVFYDGEKGFNC